MENLRISVPPEKAIVLHNLLTALREFGEEFINETFLSTERVEIDSLIEWYEFKYATYLAKQEVKQKFGK